MTVYGRRPVSGVLSITRSDSHPKAGIEEKQTKIGQALKIAISLSKSTNFAEVRADPAAARYLRRLVQGAKFLSGEDRWCLWLVCTTQWGSSIQPGAPGATCPTASVRAMANQPAPFTEIRQPTFGDGVGQRGAQATANVVDGAR
jgi:hypothetical protein